MTSAEQERKSTVLIVDDNTYTSEFISVLLQESGYVPILCNSGQHALEIIKNQIVDIVLLDVVMPDSDGLTVASQMKAFAGNEDFLPIIMVTALSSEENKIAGLAHADDYITKPFSGDELLARIKSLLRISKLHRELVHSKDRYQRLYENAPYHYLSIDCDYIITDCNQIFCRTFHVEKNMMIGTPIINLIVAEERDSLRHFLDTIKIDPSRVQQHVFSLLIGADKNTYMDLKGAYIGRDESGLSIIISMEDVTHRIHLEEEQKIARLQLYRSARLASIGTLASGVAHEMNNPLTAILGFSSALLNRLQSNDSIDFKELREYLEIISHETLRCRDIVENLSKFARDSEMSIQSISLAECVVDALKLINAKASRSGIVITNNVSQRLFVLVDGSKLEQVIVNILSNCIDFCAEGTTVTINANLSGKDRSRFITLSISDNGPGIAPEVLPKVFDPFFTTKEVGHGIGMGLAICHKIMRECNGIIDIMSKPGQGTTVVIEIPRERMNAEGENK